MVERTGARRPRWLANAAAFLILAGASGVLAPLLVETDGAPVTSSAPSGAEQTAEAPAPDPTVHSEVQPAEPATDTSRQALDTAERGTGAAAHLSTGTSPPHTASIARPADHNPAAERPTNERSQATERPAAEQQAREKDRQVIDSLTRDLAAAREEVPSLKARLEAETAERLKITQAIERAEAAAAAERQARERDHQVIDTLRRDLGAAREEVASLKAHLQAQTAERLKVSEARERAEAAVAEERQARERDRHALDSLSRDLGAAREEVASLKARLEAEAAERLKVSQAIERAETAAAEQRQALEEERQQAAALARTLDSTRKQVEHLTAVAARAQAETTEHKLALDRERTRGSILEPPAFVLGTPIPVRTTSVSAEAQSKGPPSGAPSQGDRPKGDSTTNR